MIGGEVYGLSSKTHAPITLSKRSHIMKSGGTLPPHRTIPCALLRTAPPHVLTTTEETSNGQSSLLLVVLEVEEEEEEKDKRQGRRQRVLPPMPPKGLLALVCAFIWRE